MAASQHFITARPSADGVTSIDTWGTLAARASQLADVQVTAHDLIAVNVGGGATADQVNAWLAAVGGTLSSDGINYILPAGYLVRLPPNVSIPQTSDETAVAAAAANPEPAEPALANVGGIGPSANLLAIGLMVVGGVALFNAIAGKPQRRRRR